MSNRPETEQGRLRGHPRTTGELGRIDSRAQSALALEPAAGARYSTSFIRTSNPLQYAQSEEDFRNIYGSSALEELTVSIWVKADGVAPAAARGIIQATDVSTAGAWSLEWFSASGVEFFVNTASTVSNRSLSPGVTVGAWNHFCCTYKRTDATGATIRVFTNAVGPTTSGTFSTAKTLEYNVPLEMNRRIFRDGSATNYSEQKLAYLQIWNRQLTSGEAAALYNGGSPLKVLTPALLSGLKLFWRMGDSYQERQRGLVARARCLFDESGNNRHGRILSDHASAPVYPTFVLDAP